jgi:hypothetical protein
LQEQECWAAGGSGSDSTLAVFPARLFSVQNAGFERWHRGLHLRGGEAYDLLEKPFPTGTAAARLLAERITAKQRISPAAAAEAQMGRGSPLPATETLPKGEPEKSLVRASATADLNVFFACPARWLYKKIFALAEFSLEAQLLDDASLGLLYHQILKDLFTRIREEDGVFKAERLKEYGTWIEEITVAAARKYPAFQGPLAIPLVVSQAKAITGRIKELLKAEAQYFAGYTVADLETRLGMVQDGLYLNGILDRVSVSPEGIPVIIDYKTGGTPSKKESSESADSALADFQMSMYVKLYEAKTGVPVEGAHFFSINAHDITAVVGSPGRKRGHTREAYQETLDAFDGYTRQFRDALEAMDFAPGETDFAACLGCDYRNICRSTFALNAKASKGDTHVR